MTESRWTIDAAGRLCCYGDPIRAKSSWQTVADALNDYIDVRKALGCTAEPPTVAIRRLIALSDTSHLLAAERERCAKLLETEATADDRCAMAEHRVIPTARAVYLRVGAKLIRESGEGR